MELMMSRVIDIFVRVHQGRFFVQYALALFLPALNILSCIFFFAVCR
jgi:hypothetical protein